MQASMLAKKWRMVGWRVKSKQVQAWWDDDDFFCVESSGEQPSSGGGERIVCFSASYGF